MKHIRFLHYNLLRTVFEKDYVVQTISASKKETLQTDPCIGQIKETESPQKKTTA